jgi:hypothetical protein
VQFGIMGKREKGADWSEMKCQEVEEALTLSTAGGTQILMPSVQAHIEECPACQQLARVLKLRSGEAQVDSDQLERLRKIIVDDLRPVRPLLPSLAFLLAFSLIFVGFSFLGVLYLGAKGWFVLMPAQKIAVFASLAGSAALLAFSLVRQMVPGQKSVLHPGTLPIAVFVLLCLVLASVFQVRADPHFLRAGEACLKAGLPYAIPAALLFWLILRRGALLSPRIVGAMAGMLAGLVSTTVLEVHCPNLDVWHILVWHVGIAFLGMITGLLTAIAGQAIPNRQP